MISRINNLDQTQFQAKLRIADKTKTLSENAIKNLKKIAADIGMQSDEITIDIFTKDRAYITYADEFQFFKEPHLTVNNKFDFVSWEDNKPDMFLRNAFKKSLEASVREKELSSVSMIYDVLKHYLCNFADYNSEFISKYFKRLNQLPPTEEFKLTGNIENISLGNIDKLVPLYRKYQEGMNQIVDNQALKGYIERILDNKNKIFIIKEKGVPSGFLHFSVSHSTIDMTPFTTLQSLFVDANFRHRGLAQQLLAEVERWTEYMGFKGISVKTQAQNPASVGLFKSSGFISEKDKYAMFFRPNKQVLDYKKGYVYTKEDIK